MIDRRDRYRGALLGLATGDALGTALEFRAPETFRKIDDMVGDYWDENPLVAQIGEIASGSFKHREPPLIAGSGYLVKSLEAALWAFHHSSDFRESCLLAVNLGDDADTTGAIYGQLAGVFYGEQAIPLAWRAKLAHRELITSFADKLLILSEVTARSSLD
jgi:ADP-ribosylglycohydrolase